MSQGIHPGLPPGLPTRSELATSISWPEIGAQDRVGLDLQDQRGLNPQTDAVLTCKINRVLCPQTASVSIFQTHTVSYPQTDAVFTCKTNGVLSPQSASVSFRKVDWV